MCLGAKLGPLGRTCDRHGGCVQAVIMQCTAVLGWSVCAMLNLCSFRARRPLRPCPRVPGRIGAWRAGGGRMDFSPAIGCRDRALGRLSLVQGPHQVIWPCSRFPADYVRSKPQRRVLLVPWVPLGLTWRDSVADIFPVLFLCAWTSPEVALERTAVAVDPLALRFQKRVSHSGHGLRLDPRAIASLRHTATNTTRLQCVTLRRGRTPHQ